MQEKISKIEEEIQSQKCPCVAEMEVDHLHTNTHLLQVAYLVEEDVRRPTRHIVNRVQSLSWPRGESGGLAWQDGEHSRTLGELLGTIYDKSDFEKGKAPRIEPVEDLVIINIHPTDVSKTTRIGVLLQGERKA